MGRPINEHKHCPFSCYYIQSVAVQESWTLGQVGKSPHKIIPGWPGVVHQPGTAIIGQGKSPIFVQNYGRSQTDQPWIVECSVSRFWLVGSKQAIQTLRDWIRFGLHLQVRLFGIQNSAGDCRLAYGAAKEGIGKLQHQGFPHLLPLPVFQ